MAQLAKRSLTSALMKVLQIVPCALLLFSSNCHATSIMAAKYEHGVVIGADSRSSVGSFVANKAAEKLQKVNDGIYICRSGSAAGIPCIHAWRRSVALHS